MDITIGNDAPAVKAFDATRGYDLASGLGTIEGTQLTTSLVKHRR